MRNVNRQQIEFDLYAILTSKAFNFENTSCIQIWNFIQELLEKSEVA